MSDAEANRSTQDGTISDEWDSDTIDWLDPIFYEATWKIRKRCQAFDNQSKAIYAELEIDPTMGNEKLGKVVCRLNRLITAMRDYGVSCCHVTQGGQVFECFERMWETIKTIRIRTVGSLDVAEGLPKYTWNEAYVRRLLLRAADPKRYSFRSYPLRLSDTAPFPDRFFVENALNPAEGSPFSDNFFAEHSGFFEYT